MEFRAKAKNLELLVVYGKNLPLNIYTDDKRLKSILINLIANAIKYTFEGSIKLFINKTQS